MKISRVDTGKLDLNLGGFLIIHRYFYFKNRVKISVTVYTSVERVWISICVIFIIVVLLFRELRKN